MINIEAESKKISEGLRAATSYLECEKVVIRNIKQLVIEGAPIPEIEVYLKKLLHYIEEKLKTNKNYKDSINYLNAGTFVRTLLSTPYWHSWINTVK